MRDCFYSLADEIGALLKAGKVFTCHLVAQDSDYVRLNHNRVRQCGRVRQIEIDLDLIKGGLHAAAQFNVGARLITIARC
jgi:hypothetical protein